MTFWPLTENSLYKIYYIIGNENPFSSIITSEVKSIPFSTKALIPYSNNAVIKKTILIVSLILLIIF